MNNKKIIVTGGSGYLGKYIINELIKKYQVISLDKKKINLNNKNFTMVKSSIKNFFEKKKIDGIYAIIHLATAETRSNLYFNNPEFALQNVSDMYSILDAIKVSEKKPILIFSSSKQIENDNKNFIKNPYSLSKEFCENLAIFYSKNYGIKTYILRFSDIFSLSNNSPKKALMVLINKSLKNKQIKIYDSNHFFEYISIQDIVNGIIKILKIKKHKTKQINFYGQKIKILKLAKNIKKLTKSRSKLQIKDTKSNIKKKIPIEYYKIDKKWKFDSALLPIIRQVQKKINF